MSAIVRSALLSFTLAATGCVAPEEPPPLIRPAAAAPAPSIRSSDTFEDAPLPNRKLGAPADASIIRLGK